MPHFMHQPTSMAFWSRGGGSCVWRWRAQNTSVGTSFLSNKKTQRARGRVGGGRGGRDANREDHTHRQTNEEAQERKGNKERRGRCEQKRDVLTKTGRTDQNE